MKSLTKVKVSTFTKKHAMPHVTFNAIERAIDRIDNLDDDGLEALSEKYAKSQPDLLGYVLSAPTEYGNEELGGLLIYYYCLISDAFQEEGLEPNTVSNEDIEAFEEPFFELLEALYDAENLDILEDFCDQPELVKFMSMEISTEDVDGTSLSEETANQLFIVCIALITLLSRACSN
jgi:hypothetical protein